MIHNLHSCGAAVRRISEMQDAPLNRTARVSLWIHLAICSHCRRYARQIRFLHSLLADSPERLSSKRLSAEARARIVRQLKGQFGNPDE
jgi:hypothetical protein